MARKVKARSKIGIAPKIIGVGIAAVVAGIAGAHFLDSAKKRKKLKGWMLKMKGEALERIENLREATEPAYHKAIDQAAKQYISLKHIDQKELAAVTKELKNHWKSINRQIEKLRK